MSSRPPKKPGASRRMARRCSGVAAGGQREKDHLQEEHHEVGQAEQHPVLTEGIGDSKRGNEHGRRRGEDHQPRGDYLLSRYGVGQPRVTRPRRPQYREQRGGLQHPQPREVIDEEAGYLGEGEDEDQVEEQLQRSDTLLDRIPALRYHTRRACRAHPMSYFPSRL